MKFFTYIMVPIFFSFKVLHMLLLLLLLLLLYCMVIICLFVYFKYRKILSKYSSLYNITYTKCGLVLTYYKIIYTIFVSLSIYCSFSTCLITFIKTHAIVLARAIWLHDFEEILFMAQRT